MGATMTSVAGLLKEVYEGDVNDAVNNEMVLSKRIERTSDDVFENAGGKYTVFPIHTGRNHGISYRSEMQQLAPAKQQKYAAAQENLGYGYGRILLSGQTLELAEKNPQSFASALDGEVDGIKTDVARDQNRIMVGHAGSLTVGSTGVMSRSTAITAGATLTVDTTHQLEIGMIVDITDNTGVAVAGGTGREIVDIPTATTVTMDAAVAGTIVGSNIVRTGNFGKEPFSINWLVGNTGTVHNINSATAGNQYWQSVVDSTSTTLSEELMIGMAHNIHKKSGKLPTAVFTTHGLQRGYYVLFKNLRRYNEPKEWPGGLVGLSFNHGKEIPLVIDRDIQAKAMFMINEPELKIYRTKPWYFDDFDGDMFKWVPDFDAYQAMMKQYWQFVTHLRGTHGLFTNLTES